MTSIPIKLFNSLTDQVETFVPINPGHVSMYVCGPTVYNYLHIGNLRPVVVFDVLRKLFIATGYQVKFVSNITDIDDKIVQKAHDEGVKEHDVSSTFTKHYLSDLQAIASMVPDILPTVTEHIESMITFIQTLLDKGYAYQTNGDVYFRVNSISGYGRLANIDVDDLKSGSRVDINDGKENPLDFALWKKVKQGMTFDAPFGKGRPGWHTECVVMIQETFHQPLIDIHGGGFDLKFPHHENEIAQSLAMHNTSLARYWLHNGFINVDQQKMSKSLGNTVLAKDFIATYSGALLRYVLLATHYRMPVNMSEAIIDNAKNELQRIHSTIRQLALYLQMENVDVLRHEDINIDSFLTILGHDINTANALTEIHSLVKVINVSLRQKDKDLKSLTLHFFTIRKMLSILGLDLNFTVLSSNDKVVYSQYEVAKANKDYQTSDELRKILTDRDILV